MPPRQHYESGEIPEHDDYSYDNDSVSGPSNFNQEHNTSNIEGDESNDDMQSDKSGDENVQSDESDQENEINEMDNTCPKEPNNKNTKDAVNDPIREIFNLDVNQPVPQDIRHTPHSNEK
ncbi:9316_t:CDS:2 [Cetraspora pellucida]|uniref:9316_t:CDS:1 n=1 Tax=Cetraspora pellucida TaxID=1433469 RepID=A0A9N9P7X9_9GLOM|nr:9316_t:CDS:2 [Cetraspora pellucida]